MKHQRVFLLPIALLAGLMLAAVTAASPMTATGEDYIFQADDQLGKLAEKYYGFSQAYPAIIEATNTLAVEDNAYQSIDNPNHVWIGQRLFVPSYEQVPDNLMADAPLQENPAIEAVAPTQEQLELLASLQAKGFPPELNNEVWLNTNPLKLADLHGKVVIIEFWTYG